MQSATFFNRLTNKDFWTKLFFPFIGIASLVWFLIRVIPKPSRAGYPCMRVAAPLASSYVIYIVSIIGSIAAFKYAKVKFKDARYISGILALMVFLSLGSWFMFDSAEPAQASKSKMIEDLPVNQPMGEAEGIFPGRVVWVHDADATNENCDPMEENNSYFEPQNNNQTVIDEMLSKAIQSLTGTTSDSAAWDALFKFHNQTRGKGEVSYQAGEKVFIKLNATSAWSGNYNDADLSKVYSSFWGGVNRYYGLSETSPVFILSVLRQLVNNVKVTEEDIYIGDPMKFIYKHSYDYLHAEFPNVHYLDHTGHTNLGRELADKELRL